MLIAVEGCAHGELENIYNTIEYIEKQNNINIELLLCCGDFQAIRNLNDLKSMAAPPKFRSLCTFYKYYSGEKIAPKLTIFIGGNHEASNYLQELPYGGWVAPNIYYLGYAGVVNVGGIRIAGLSGIFKDRDYSKGRFEKPPYNDETLRSCYHIRNLDVFRLKQLSPSINVMLSHDWPAGITSHGNIQQLLKNKPFFKEDIDNKTLGNKPTAELLEILKPDYWFAAHLHVKFAALVKHNIEPLVQTTKFLSLDKCLPKRKFLQIIEIPHNTEREIQLKYDLEWLTILFLTNHLISIKKLNTYMPGPFSNERWIFTPTHEEMEMVLKKLQNNLNIPKNFCATAPAHSSNIKINIGSDREILINPQTVEFCDKLGVDDPLSLLLKESGFNDTNSSLNLSDFESSSFIQNTDSELENSLSQNDSISSCSKKIRSPLKLPSPCINRVAKNQNEKFSNVSVNKMENKNLASTPPINEVPKDALQDSTAEESAGDLSFQKPKKFKRRNIALYSSNEEE